MPKTLTPEETLTRIHDLELQLELVTSTLERHHKALEILEKMNQEQLQMNEDLLELHVKY